MDLSYRSTISIYKVSVGIKGCSCLHMGDVWVGNECFLPKALLGGQLRAESIPRLSCSSSCGL